MSFIVPEEVLLFYFVGLVVLICSLKFTLVNKFLDFCTWESALRSFDWKTTRGNALFDLTRKYYFWSLIGRIRIKSSQYQITKLSCESCQSIDLLSKQWTGFYMIVTSVMKELICIRNSKDPRT